MHAKIPHIVCKKDSDATKYLIDWAQVDDNENCMELPPLDAAVMTLHAELNIGKDKVELLIKAAQELHAERDHLQGQVAQLQVSCLLFLYCWRS